MKTMWQVTVEDANGGEHTLDVDHGGTLDGVAEAAIADVKQRAKEKVIDAKGPFKVLRVAKVEAPEPAESES
jgi:hypothetical protein